MLKGERVCITKKFFNIVKEFNIANIYPFKVIEDKQALLFKLRNYSVDIQFDTPNKMPTEDFVTECPIKKMLNNIINFSEQRLKVEFYINECWIQFIKYTGTALIYRLTITFLAYGNGVTIFGSQSPKRAIINDALEETFIEYI